MELSSNVELYDSDLLAIEKGPLNWMGKRRGQRMNLENFRKAVVDQFAMVGFVVDVKCYDTNETEVYAFDVEIKSRTEAQAFDYDRMRHEVVNNLLDIPGVTKGELIKAPTKAEVAAIIEKERHQH